MVISLLRKLFASQPVPRPPRRTFRPRLECLEDRFTPANLTWVGAANAGWSTPTNWSPAQVPLAADTVIFDAAPGVGANTASKMDLGGVASYHVASLVTQNGYNQKITLNANLFVDVLTLNTRAEVTGTGGLYITQRTNGKDGIPVATLFGTSFFYQGTISAAAFGVYADVTHQATLMLGSAVGATTYLSTDMFTADEFVTVKWTQGDIEVLKGKTVTNRGTFLLDSNGGTMGNTGGAADKWTFENFNILNLGKGKLSNQNLVPKAGSRQFKVASLSGGTNVFEVSGSVVLADATTTLEVDAGTLKIDASLTQSAGTTTVMNQTTLATAGISLSGGIFNLMQGTVTSTADVQVLSGGTFSGTGEVTLLTSGGAFDNYGTVTIAGVNAIGTLHVTGNYAQTGTLNVEVGGPFYADRLGVSGLATLGGTLNVTVLSGSPPPGIGSVYHVLTYGSRSGMFGTVNLPTLTTGQWSTRYDDPAYPNELSLWVT